MIALDQKISASLELHVVLEVVVLAASDPLIVFVHEHVLMHPTNPSIQLSQMYSAVQCYHHQHPSLMQKAYLRP
jgi:hypothetical protein